MEKGWHVCRTKLARYIFFEARIFSRKCSEVFPEMFEPLFCGSEKIRKIPAKFPAKFPSQKQKIHRRASAVAPGEYLEKGWKRTDSHLQNAGACPVKLCPLAQKETWPFLKRHLLCSLESALTLCATSNLPSPSKWQHGKDNLEEGVCLKEDVWGTSRNLARPLQQFVYFVKKNDAFAA